MRAKRLNRIDALIASAIGRHQIAGAVVSVSRGNHVLLEKPYGVANAYADGEPLERTTKMTLDHVFDLASMTKAFAATLAAMLLFEDGVLDLEASVGQYLPEFREPRDKREVRVHHLLSHTSGLPSWAPLQSLRIDRAQVPAVIAGFPLIAQAGKERCYSDLGYMLLGSIIESIAGEPLDQLLQRRIYGPLNLRTMEFNPKSKGLGPWVATSQGNMFERDMATRLIEEKRFGASASFADWRTELIIGEVNDSNTFHVFKGVSAHAGLFSAVTDLRVLARFLLNASKSDAPKVFSQRTLDAFAASGAGAFGWASRAGKASLETCEALAGPLPPGTLFAQGFTGTFAYLEPGADTAIILLTNRLQMGRGPDGNYAKLDALFARIVQMARGL